MTKNEPLSELVEFERQIGLGPTAAARLLGMPYITYAQYRAGSRPFRLCHRLHVEVILLLPSAQRQRLIQRIVYGNER